MDNHAKKQRLAVTPLEADAIAFVKAVVKADKEHPDWSPFDSYLVDTEISAWNRLKRAVRRELRG